LSIKDVRIQAEEWGFVQCGHLEDKGVLPMRSSALFVQKTLNFTEQGGGINFSRFYAEVLRTALICLIGLRHAARQKNRFANKGILPELIPWGMV